MLRIPLVIIILIIGMICFNNVLDIIDFVEERTSPINCKGGCND